MDLNKKIISYETMETSLEYVKEYIDEKSGKGSTKISEMEDFDNTVVASGTGDYIAMTKNTDGKWQEEDIKNEEYTEEELKALLGLTQTELDYLSSVINDNVVETGKTWSSSKIFSDIVNVKQDKLTAGNNIRIEADGTISSIGNPINLYDKDTYYEGGDVCHYNNYVYMCNNPTTGDFDPSRWVRLGDYLTALTEDDIKDMLALTTEQLDTLASIILDGEIRVDKTHSSSKIYADIQEAIQTAKDYTLKEIGKAVGASYSIVTTVDDMVDDKVIYLLLNGNVYDMYIVEEDGSAVKIGDLNVDLSNYYTKSEIDNDFLKKVEAEGIYAKSETITNHIDDTAIHLTQTERDKILTKDDIVTILNEDVTDEQIGSAKVVHGELNKKVDKASIATTLDDTVTDNQVPSAKVVYDIATQVDAISDIVEKIDDSDVITEVADGRGTYSNLSSRLNKMDTFISKNSDETDILKNKTALTSMVNRSKTQYINILNNEDWVTSFFKNPSNSDGDWILTEDTLKPTFTTLSEGGVNIFYKRKLIQDGEIGVTIKGFNIDSADNNAAMINFKGKDKNNYFTCMIFFNFKEIWLGRMVDGTFEKAKTISYDISQIVPKNGESINLSIKFHGIKFSVYLNGTALFDEVVSSYFTQRESNGMFGFGVYNGSTFIDTWTKDIIFENPWIKEYDFTAIPNNLNKILSVGDSITFGAGVQTDERWTTLLYNKCLEFNKNIVLDNVAVSGSKLDVILNQIINNILNKYDLVTILGGTNNSRIDVGTTVDEAIDILRQCIWYVKGFGAIPVVGTCLPIDRTKNTTATNSDSWAWIMEYNNKVRRLCSKENIICCDFFNNFNNDLTLLQADKIHPTADGHIKLYETMYNTLFEGNIKLS